RSRFSVQLQVRADRGGAPTSLTRFTNSCGRSDVSADAAAVALLELVLLVTQPRLRVLLILLVRLRLRRVLPRPGVGRVVTPRPADVIGPRRVGVDLVARGHPVARPGVRRRAAIVSVHGPP